MLYYRYVVFEGLYSLQIHFFFHLLILASKLVELIIKSTKYQNSFLIESEVVLPSIVALVGSMHCPWSQSVGEFFLPSFILKKLSKIFVKQLNTLKFVELQDKEMESFVEEKEKFSQVREISLAAMRKRHWVEEDEMEKKSEEDLAKLMENYSPSHQ
jgi:hypothetical protein